MVTMRGVQGGCYAIISAYSLGDRGDSSIPPTVKMDWLPYHF